MRIVAPNERTGWMFIVLAAMTWGLDIVFRSPMTAGGIDPALIVFGEHLLLTIFFLPVLLKAMPAFRALSTKQWAILVFLAWGSSAIATWLYTLAFVYGSALSAVLLQKTQPIFALALAPLFLGERRKANFWPFALLALVGAYLLALGWTSPVDALHGSHFKAALCAVAASALWGGGTIAGRALSNVLEPAALSAGRFSVALPLLGLAIFLHPSAAATLSHLHVGLAFDWLLLALVPGLLGMVLYYVGMQTTPASVATLAELAYPATAMIVGYLFLNLKLDTVQITGLVILLISVRQLATGRAIVVHRAEEMPPAVGAENA